jgi:hypothetical protein
MGLLRNSTLLGESQDAWFDRLTTSGKGSSPAHLSLSKGADVGR